MFVERPGFVIIITDREAQYGTLRILRSATREDRIRIYRTVENNQGQRLLFERRMMGDELYFSERSSGETANPLPGLRHGTGQRFPCGSFLCWSRHQLKTCTVSSDQIHADEDLAVGTIQRANRGRVIQ
jgi:hypothetical protein